jgi:hypothetical protein
MEKISPILENEINADKTAKHKVIITINETAHAENLPIKKYNKLMENVLSAELDGNEINTLSQVDDVIAIEPDSMMDAI